MRIVYYVHGWPADRVQNGVASAAAALAPSIRNAGHEAKILSLVGNPEENDDREASFVQASKWRDARPIVKVRDRLRPKLRVFRSLPEAISARVNEVPELKDANIFEIEESFGWSKAIARRISPLVAVRLHGPFFITGAAGGAPFNSFDSERIKLEGLGIAAAAAVTAPSQFVLERVRKYYDLPLADAAVIPNAVSPTHAQNRWNPDGADRDEILFVGRFDKIKGADILLRAFGMLAADRPQLRLTFAGPNAEPIVHDGRSLDYAAFTAAVMPPDAARRVAFLGKVAATELPALRRRAFLTVVSSRVETFSNALAEALSAGSPVVAVRAGGMPEIARDGVEAAFADAENPNSLANTIARLLNAPEYAAELGVAGRKHADAEFAPPRIASSFIQFYKDALARTCTGTGVANAGRRP